jgi:arylsulfatase A-like enzyme
MKAIVVMFDTLNRHMLPAYGCDWTKMPNFQRLAGRTVTFDRSYVCSMPCMPARRDFHTGRPNFLHRSWGPIEPFDDSMPQMLREAGVHTHLATDHFHYFEDGGCTYHTRYSTWQFNRGQEGDPWIGQVAEPAFAEPDVPRTAGPYLRQHRINRSFMASDADHSQTRTFRDGLDFIDRNRDEDPWLLHLETFDPHEPFFSHQKWKNLFADHYAHYSGPHFDWPPYRHVEEPPDVVEHVRYEYAALMAKCDAHLGEVLDRMDRHGMWEDTMLVVWTDHGFLLGEHDMYAKVWNPFYEEVAHTPFFVWDPRSRSSGARRGALVQPSIDLPVTLLNYFGLQPTPDMLVKDLVAPHPTTSRCGKRRSSAFTAATST